jgi:hypothetical protein
MSWSEPLGDKKESDVDITVGPDLRLVRLADFDLLQGVNN